ncbi:hypothetical protein IWZ00DRAFT_555326 [Phyllosticta capitalensis]
MDDTGTTDERFAEESARLLDALANAQSFKKSEASRLKSITDTLLHENDTLEKNIHSETPEISGEVSTIINQVPIKALTMPSNSFFDCLLPELANFEIDFDDDYGDHSDYAKIITGFRRLQANEHGFNQNAKSIQRLASENYILRLRNIALATPDVQEKLLRIHGHPFCPMTFRRNVPHYISDEEPTPLHDPHAAFVEFRAAHNGKDLVLRDLQMAPGTSATQVFYHPFDDRHIAPLWGMGVQNDNADTVWKLAEEGRLYPLEGLVNVGPQEGQKLWAPQLSREFGLSREVPHYVSSAGPPSHEDSSTAFKEFQAANGGRDLPLRYLQFAPATSSVKTYYHPFNIPPQWCSAIEYVGTNDVWEIAPEGRMYSLEGYINIGKPGEAKLWVPQICEDFDLDIP